MFQMEALYERVLAHVRTEQRHECYNAVLQEEFSSVNNAVDDVVASFAKLEEVRNAVAQLEQSHESTGRRSVSLMAATANTVLLQRELQKSKRPSGWDDCGAHGTEEEARGGSGAAVEGAKCQWTQEVQEFEIWSWHCELCEREQRECTSDKKKFEHCDDDK